MPYYKVFLNEDATYEVHVNAENEEAAEEAAEQRFINEGAPKFPVEVHAREASKVELITAAAGWTHAETSAPDDPTQQPAALRFVKSLSGQSTYQMLDASGSLVAMLTVMVPADGPAVATRLNQALAGQRSLDPVKAMDLAPKHEAEARDLLGKAGS